VYEFLLVAII